MEDGNVQTSIVNCARCNNNHEDIIFTPLTNGIRYSHFAMCPVINQPILMYIIDDSSEIDESNFKNITKTMDIYAEEGTKIVFLGKNGYPSELEYAKKVLEVGKVYTVKYVDIEFSISYVTLKEVKNALFNTVMFVEESEMEF